MTSGFFAEMAWFGAAVPASDHTRARVAARAAAIADSAWIGDLARVEIRRDTVGSEATWPKVSGRSRMVAMSARQSPPATNATARSAMILPGSCVANGVRHGASAVDTSAARLLASTVRVNRTVPAWDTRFSPSPVAWMCG
ncbi:hypothetical protein GCM10023217_03590 [Gordonia alkaliphila]|uniref:Uncharacterized protein n=1 Tax=Gordonia alkaliphila TaxID=1053547 RepID=A0ABP8YW62_9ACTN